MPQEPTRKPSVESKGTKPKVGIGRALLGLIKPEKQPIPDPFDVKANAAVPVGLGDIVPEYVERKTGSTWLGIAAGFFTPSPIRIGERLGEKLGIMAGKTGTSRIPVLKEEQKFTSKYFGERYEFHPPETLVSKAKSGELDKKIKQIVDKQESLYKEKDKILDGLPDDIYTKDFDIDLTKVPKDKADRISKIYDELDEINQTKLGSIISKEDFPELAQAYPEIFNVSLHPYVKAGSKVGGSYYPTDTGKITFNIAANKNQSSLEALMHEIQHGIQDIESGATKAARTFTKDLDRQRRMIKQQGGDIGKDIPFEKEAYESGLRDAYPELRGMARETEIK